MPVKRLIWSTLGVWLLCGWATPAPAAGVGLQVSVSVQAACFVHDDTPIQLSGGGGEVSGAVVVACNSGGYSVVANYRPLAADEAAVLQYDGQSFDLPAG